MRFIQIGHGNVVAASRIMTMTGSDSSPVKRMVVEARERGILIDATAGHKTATVIVLDSGHVVLSSCDIKMISAEVERE